MNDTRTSRATSNHEDKGGAIPTSALDLHIEETTLENAQHVNKVLHSVLPIVQGLSWGTRRIAYLATYDNITYATAIWTTPIAANRLTDGFSCLELRRFAISKYAPKNTASRLLAVNGTIYKAAGWIATEESKSVIWHEGEKRADRQTTSNKIRWEKRFEPQKGTLLPPVRVD